MQGVRSFLPGPTGLLVLWAVACGGEDFTPREEIDRLRGLGLSSQVRGAPQRVWPRTGETADLDLLVTRESPTGFVEARWSFCPVAFGSDGDFRCALNEAEFSAFVDQAIRQVVTNLGSLEDLIPGLQLPPGLELPMGFQLPPDFSVQLNPNFDLGTSRVSLTQGATTTGVPFNLRNVLFPDAQEVIPELIIDLGLQLLCTQLQAEEFPDFVERPECNGVFPFRIDVEVDALEPDQPDAVEQLRLQRFLDVVYDQSEDAPSNLNPSFERLCIVIPVSEGTGPSFESLAQSRADDEGLRLDDARAAVTRDVCARVDPSTPPGTYASVPLTGTSSVPATVVPLGVGTAPVVDFFFSVPVQLQVLGLERDDAEAYRDISPDGQEVVRTEQLALSWFSDSGSLSRSRTAFEAGVEEATIERLTSNRWALPREIDFTDPTNQAELILVLRDDRGGRDLAVVPGRLRTFSTRNSDEN